MKLRNWLIKNQITNAEFAKISGIRHKQLIGRYVNETTVPGPKNMQLIYRATNGCVTANDFFHCVSTNDDFSSHKIKSFQSQSGEIQG